DRFVDAGEDVFPVAIAEILHVGASEGFALAEAAARIWLEEEIAGAGHGRFERPSFGPIGLDGEAGAAVDPDDRWIFLCRLEIERIGQPALHVVAAIFPADALCFAPGGLALFVALGDLFPVADRAGPDFRWRGERVANDCGGFGISGEGEVWSPEASCDG